LVGIFITGPAGLIPRAALGAVAQALEISRIAVDGVAMLIAVGTLYFCGQSAQH